jgi:hypothetical protein
MKRIIFVSVIAIISISGCASRSGVVSMGNETYYVSVRSPQISFGPPITQKAEVFKQANQYCEEQGKKLETVDLKEVNQIFGRHASAQLTFRCVSEQKN